MSVKQVESLRADAQQNRDRILAVAQTAFADNLDASLNSIAKLAGVGPGTLYRHFPTREDLILAVYRHEVQVLADSVDAVLAEHAPLDALRVWFLRLAVYVRIKHGLGEALNTAVVQDSVNQTYAPVIAAVEVLLRACADAGQVKPGLKAGDVLLIMGCLWRVGPGGAEQAARLIDLVINGLRSPSSGPPGSAGGDDGCPQDPTDERPGDKPHRYETPYRRRAQIEEEDLGDRPPDPEP